MLLVLMDNATAEYAFVTTFFAEPLPSIPQSSSQKSVFSPSRVEQARRPSAGTEVMTDIAGGRRYSIARSVVPDVSADVRQPSKEEQASLTNTWKQIMEPTLNYSQVSSSEVIYSTI